MFFGCRTSARQAVSIRFGFDMKKVLIILILGALLAFAVGVSVLIRLLYHTYQGPMAVAFIFPMGVLFAVAYWRRRALWPLILAHGLFDFIGLMWS